MTANHVKTGKQSLSSTVSRFKSVSGPRDYNYFNNKFTLDFHRIPFLLNDML